MHDLPPDFEFRPYVQGPALYLGEEIVAHASPARDEPGAPWRVSLEPRKPPRFVFLRDEATSLRYMAGWAIKWEAHIRERCRNESRAFAHLATSGAEHPSRHPRGRSRRRSGL
jgi:hypothetical protein